MIRSIHNKCYAGGNGTKLPYNKSITKELIMIQYLIFKGFSPSRIVIRIVTYDNIWPSNCIFNELHNVISFNWIFICRIWAVCFIRFHKYSLPLMVFGQNSIDLTYYIPLRTIRLYQIRLQYHAALHLL